MRPFLMKLIASYSTLAEREQVSLPVQPTSPQLAVYPGHQIAFEVLSV